MTDGVRNFRRRHGLGHGSSLPRSAARSFTRTGRCEVGFLAEASSTRLSWHADTSCSKAFIQAALRAARPVSSDVDPSLVGRCSVIPGLTTKTSLFAGILELSDGLKPSTPSWPWSVSGDRPQPTGNGFGLFSPVPAPADLRLPLMKAPSLCCPCWLLAAERTGLRAAADVMMHASPERAALAGRDLEQAERA
jgi:hypothetical protein